MGWMAAAGFLVTLAQAQAWQSPTQGLMSFFIVGQITLVDNSLLVALASGCTMLWKAADALWQWSRGMTDLGYCMGVSHRMGFFLNLMSLRAGLEPLAASMLEQDRCDAWRAA